MAARHFNVHVVQPDGRHNVEVRKVLFIPDGLSDQQVEDLLRTDWGKHFPGETYVSIEEIRGYEPVPKPHPGMFPTGVNL